MHYLRLLILVGEKLSFILKSQFIAFIEEFLPVFVAVSLHDGVRRIRSAAISIMQAWLLLLKLLILVISLTIWLDLIALYTPLLQSQIFDHIAHAVLKVLF